MELLISGSLNAFADGFNAPGVYMASGIVPSESFPIPVYVGSSVDLKKRIVFEHVPRLTCGEHKCKPLRSYCTKYGVENLVWYLLETCKRDETLTREQHYLDTLRPYIDEKRGFNSAKSATAPGKGCRWNIGRKASESTKRKQSENNTGSANPFFGRKHSEAVKKRQAALRKGNKWNAHLERAFKVISPQGETIEGRGLTAFCSLHGLTRCALRGVLEGTRAHHKGWRKA